MKINELSIEGFRGFKDKVEFKLDPQVNVFLGVNGAGKTTVLDAIQDYLGFFIYSGISNNSNITYEHNLHDINVESEQIIVEIITSWKQIKGTTLMTFNIDTTNNSSTNENQLNKLFDALKTNKSLPLVLYFNKNNDMSDDRNFYSDYRINNLYSNFSNPIKQSFNSLSKWLIKETHLENQGKIKHQDFNYNNPKLELFRLFLSNFLKEIDNEQNKYEYEIFMDFSTGGDLSINFLNQNYEDYESLYIKKNNKSLLFNSLSQGEKEIILMISEIIRRAIFASLSSKIEEVKNVEGIILIDEIEQHLHPKWQRNIIPALTKVFPKIQWFVTTHSPQVLSNLKRENIHLIEDFKVVKNIDPTYGEDSNSILENIFGVKKRPDHAEKHFDKFYRMLEKDAESSLKVLEELEEVYTKEHLEVKKARLEYEYEYGKYS